MRKFEEYFIPQPGKIFDFGQGVKRKDYVVTELNTQTDAERKMLSDAGYAEPAITYYLEKKYMGVIEDADQVSQKVGSCGDTMKIYIKLDDDKRIQDIRYEITGCAGAISAAMASVDLARGKTLEEALLIDDGAVFQALVNIPEKKHHCIQLAVKTMHQGIEEYKTKDPA